MVPRDRDSGSSDSESTGFRRQGFRKQADSGPPKSGQEGLKQILETGIGGGVKPPKTRGGVKILNFQGPLKLTAKVQFFEGRLLGRVLPALAFGTF